MAGRRPRKRKSLSAADGRIRLLSAILAVCFLAVAVKALTLTATSAGLGTAAQRQSQQEVLLPAHRGDIVDRNGTLLAVGKVQMTVWATPHQLTDPRGVARRLAAVLHVSRPKLEKQLLRHDSWYTCVASKIDPSKARKATALGIDGVGASPEEKRVYPLRSLASQVIGFAGTDNKGLAGLELGYDSELEGKAGSELVVCDPSGTVIKTDRERDPRSGATVRLTIDKDIQFEAERVLLETVRHFKAKDAVGIVMDPRSGEVLAMANVPLVNGNQWGDSKAELERNRAVSDIFEPGSIFKVVTVSAALQDGLVTPNTSFVLPYQIVVDGKPFHDAHLRPTERLTVREILAQSSNVGAARLGKMLGKKELLSWVKRFGFGKPTGVAFPGEASGLLPAYWAQSTIASVPMGQGISVTALQMAAAYAAIGNGGVWQVPRLVAQVGTRLTQPVGKHRVISAKVASQVLSMMNDAVMEGTATAFKIPGYAAAGKTGTAQVPYYDRPGYAPGQYKASFVGLVPSDHPRLLVMVVVDEPTTQIYGGQVAAPAAREIAEFALQNLKIAP